MISTPTHVVFIPKRRRKVVFGRMRSQLEKFSMPWYGRKNARFSKGT